MVHPNAVFHFFVGGPAVAAAWTGFCILLIHLFKLRDPRARVIVLVVPLVAMFIARLDLSGEFTCLLLAISLLISGLMFGRDLRCYRHHSQALSTSFKTHPVCDHLATRLAILFKIPMPTVFISSEVAQPFTAGHRQPIIVIPQSLMLGLNETELEVLLAHEMAHIQRSDFLLRWILLFVTRLSWLNPIAPTLFRRICFETECACDKLASQLTGRPGTLARTLIKTERLVSLQSKQACQHLVMGGCSFLEKRVRLLGVADTEPAETIPHKVGFILSTLTVACFKAASAWYLLASI